jgi:hypothetical protein
MASLSIWLCQEAAATNAHCMEWDTIIPQHASQKYSPEMYLVQCGHIQSMQCGHIQLGERDTQSCEFDKSLRWASQGALTGA